MIRETSLRAYESVDLNSRQADVLNAITELGECTDAEIAGHTGWAINRITPRRGELLAANLIEECGRKVGPTGRSATVWRLTLPKSQPSFQYDKEGQAILFA